MTTTWKPFMIVALSAVHYYLITFLVGHSALLPVPFSEDVLREKPWLIHAHLLMYSLIAILLASMVTAALYRAILRFNAVVPSIFVTLPAIGSCVYWYMQYGNMSTNSTHIYYWSSGFATFAFLPMIVAFSISIVPLTSEVKGQ